MVNGTLFTLLKSSSSTRRFVSFCQVELREFLEDQFFFLEKKGFFSGGKGVWVERKRKGRAVSFLTLAAWHCEESKIRKCQFFDISFLMRPDFAGYICFWQWMELNNTQPWLLQFLAKMSDRMNRFSSFRLVLKVLWTICPRLNKLAPQD